MFRLPSQCMAPCDLTNHNARSDRDLTNHDTRRDGETLDSDVSYEVECNEDSGFLVQLQGF